MRPSPPKCAACKESFAMVGKTLCPTCANGQTVTHEQATQATNTEAAPTDAPAPANEGQAQGPAQAAGGAHGNGAREEAGDAVAVGQWRVWTDIDCDVPFRITRIAGPATFYTYVGGEHGEASSTWVADSRLATPREVLDAYLATLPEEKRKRVEFRAYKDGSSMVSGPNCADPFVDGHVVCNIGNTLPTGARWWDEPGGDLYTIDDMLARVRDALAKPVDPVRAALANAPDDDEPETPEEAAAVEQAKAEPSMSTDDVIAAIEEREPPPSRLIVLDSLPPTEVDDLRDQLAAVTAERDLWKSTCNDSTELMTRVGAERDAAISERDDLRRRLSLHHDRTAISLRPARELVANLQASIGLLGGGDDV